MSVFDELTTYARRYCRRGALSAGALAVGLFPTGNEDVAAALVAVAAVLVVVDAKAETKVESWGR